MQPSSYWPVKQKKLTQVRNWYPWKYQPNIFWKFSEKIWQFPNLATVSTDNLSIEPLLYMTTLTWHFHIKISLFMHTMKLLSAKFEITPSTEAKILHLHCLWMLPSSGPTLNHYRLIIFMKHTPHSHTHTVNHKPHPIMIVPYWWRNKSKFNGESFLLRFSSLSPFLPFLYLFYTFSALCYIFFTFLPVQFRTELPSVQENENYCGSRST
jgi:hypothetical protein